jgi:signal transduction histidine kinase
MWTCRCLDRVRAGESGLELRAVVGLDLLDVERQPREEHGIAVACEITGTERTVPTDAAVVVLRTVQESLANVGKHAVGADRVELTLELRDDRVNLCVHDNGAGFHPTATITGNANGNDRDKDTGHGIPGIRARAEEAGGHADVHSGPSGTTLRAWVPYRQADAPEAAP